MSNKRKRTKRELEADALRTGRPSKKKTTLQVHRISVGMNCAEAKQLSRLADCEGVTKSEILLKAFKKYLEG